MNLLSFKQLGEKILAIKPLHSQKVIAIDGGGAAGKSTFAKCLEENLQNSVIIHVDDFYKGPWDKRLDNKDYVVNPFFDWERFVDEVLLPIQENKLVQYHVYNWHTHTAEQVVSVTEDTIIIIEGGYTTQVKFSNLYDFKIWIEADESLRLEKALKRDGEHMRFLWEEDWLPIERNYIREDNPKSRADLVVNGQSGDFAGGTFEILAT